MYGSRIVSGTSVAAIVLATTTYTGAVTASTGTVATMVVSFHDTTLPSTWPPSTLSNRTWSLLPSYTPNVSPVSVMSSPQNAEVGFSPLTVWPCTSQVISLLG